MPGRIVVRTSHTRANYVIREIVDLGTISSASSDSFGAYSFQFNLLPNASSWGNIFDRYRFLGVKVTFEPVGIQVATDGTVYQVPRFATVVDFDDNSSPASFASMERSACFCGTNSTTPLIRHFLPRVTRPVYISGVSTGYQEGDPLSWQDMAYQTIPHYGLKWGIGAVTGTGGQFRYQVTAEFLVEVAGQRG